MSTTTTNREQIYNDINTELDYAEARWGTEFDSKNTLNDWAAYTSIYLSTATKMNLPKEEVRRQLIKAAGLIVSTIKWLDSGEMPKRHYDQ